MGHVGRARWLWCACMAGIGCSRPSIHTAAPITGSPRLERQDTSEAGPSPASSTRSRKAGATRSNVPEPLQLSESSECTPINDAAQYARFLASDSANDSVGLVCFAKPARYVCPRDDGSACHDRFRVLVGENGEPLEQRFHQSRLCNGASSLYGCNRKGGGEVIPFIHSEPIEFTPSGFALVAEEFREDTHQGGYFYVDSRYEQKVEALTIEGVAESLLPLSVVRYRKDGKIGFLDLRSGKITDPIFNAAFSFYASGGRTLVCEDCDPKRWEECAPPEAQCSGTAYLIDERGKRLREKPSEHYAEYWWCKRHRGQRFKPPGEDCD